MSGVKVYRTPDTPGHGWLLGPRGKLKVGQVVEVPEREHACLTNVRLRAATVVVTGENKMGDGLFDGTDKSVFDLEGAAA